MIVAPGVSAVTWLGAGMLQDRALSVASAMSSAVVWLSTTVPAVSPIWGVTPLALTAVGPSPTPLVATTENR